MNEAEKGTQKQTHTKWPTVLENEAKTAFATNGTGIAGHPHAKKKK